MKRRDPFKVKSYFEDFYAGKIHRPCDEDCTENCDGEHNYQLGEYQPIFPEAFNTKEMRERAARNYKAGLEIIRLRDET